MNSTASKTTTSSNPNNNNNNNNNSTDSKESMPRVVIGLEIHCQMTSLNSKLFCSCKADYRKMSPNQNICPICMGLPGALPLLNREAVCKGAMIAMALECTIPEKISFFRKNYFYPDLPKNFQITQLNIHDDVSIGGKGVISIDDKKIRIRRIQLEEDPGRMIYEGVSVKNMTSLVDYNRAGAPLVEIVTEPDFESPRQVRLFLQMLSDMIENLEVSNPALEGAMRADANVSLAGSNRVEIKNINSFHDLEKAVIFEITRQKAQYSRGLEIKQETRHWDANRKITISARLKEGDMDYRYLPEADIPWVKMDKDTLKSLKEKMPESISEKRTRYTQKYKIPSQVADVLASDKLYSDLFDAAHTDSNAREMANIITTDLMGIVDVKQQYEKKYNEKEKSKEHITDNNAIVNDRNDINSKTSPITPDNLQKLVDAITSGKIARNSAKQVLYEMVKTKKSFDEITANMKLNKLSDAAELDNIIKQVIAEETDAAKQATSNPNTINYLVGKVMQKTKGRADPQMTMTILREKIQKNDQK